MKLNNNIIFHQVCKNTKSKTSLKMRLINKEFNKNYNNFRELTIGNNYTKKLQKFNCACTYFYFCVINETELKFETFNKFFDLFLYSYNKLKEEKDKLRNIRDKDIKKFNNLRYLDISGCSSLFDLFKNKKIFPKLQQLICYDCHILIDAKYGELRKYLKYKKDNNNKFFYDYLNLEGSEYWMNNTIDYFKDANNFKDTNNLKENEVNEFQNKLKDIKRFVDRELPNSYLLKFD